MPKAVYEVNCWTKQTQAASSKAHLITIIETSEREARETQAALEIIIDAEYVKPSRLTSLYQESSEIVAILTTIAKNTLENQQEQRR